MSAAANIKTRVRGKLQFALFPFVVLVEVVKVMMFGAVKYEPNNWQEATDPREPYYDALWRHVGAWWSGDVVDPETGISHLAHGIACLTILLWHAFKRGDVAPADLGDVMQRAEKARAERLAREAAAASTPANDRPLTRVQAAERLLFDELKKAQETGPAQKLVDMMPAPSRPLIDSPPAPTDPSKSELRSRKDVGCACTHPGLCSESRGCACGKAGFYVAPASAPAAS